MPEIERALWNEIDSGWRQLLRGDLAGALAAARAAASTPQGKLLSVQVAHVKEQAGLAEELQDMVHAYPDYAAAWLTLSATAEREGNESVAYQAALRGAELWDRRPWRDRPQELYALWVTARITEARRLIDGDDPEQALMLIDAALALDPEVENGLLLKAHALVALERSPEAVAILQTLPEHPDAILLSAELAENAADWPEAMNLYRSLPEGFPQRDASLRRAQLRWRMSILPAYVQDALDSPALTRAELAVVLVAVAPELDAAEGGKVPLLSDIVDLPSQHEVLTVVRVDLLGVDPLEHRFYPHREATTDEARDAVEALSHLLGFVTPLWCTDDTELVPSECTALSVPVSGRALSEVILAMESSERESGFGEEE